MAYNPKKSTPGIVISHAKWRMEQARAEVAEEEIHLRPHPLPNKPLGKKLEYYIEVWKIGTDASKIFASMFNTANLKHVLKLILRTNNYAVVYLRRSHDQKIIWDKR